MNSWLFCEVHVALSQAFMKLMGNPKKKPVVNVDMSAELTKHSLLTHFLVACWPPTQAVTQLATWVKAAKKYKGDKAYVFVDLKR